MSSPMEPPVLLTVRGTLIPKNLESARSIHNETAGSPQGIAAARALGDLSHKVYVPCTRSKQSTAKPGELLFLDRWIDAQGIMQFFSNPHVQEQGGNLFSAREPAIWMAARGAFSIDLPAAASKDERYLGMLRGPVASPEKAIELFRAADEKGLRDARRRGLLSHALFIQVKPPGDASPLELTGLDLWCDFDGMSEHYADQGHNQGIGQAFSGAPQPTVWEQAPGNWSEW